MLIEIPKIIQITGTTKMTVIAANVTYSHQKKKPYSIIENIRMITINGVKIIHNKLVISSNFNTFNSFSSTNVVFETHISHFLTITNSNTKQDEPVSDDTKVDPLPLNHARTIVAMFDNIQHDAAPNCNQSPVPSIPYTKTLIIQHRLAKVCPSHSKLSALLIRVSLEPMT